MFPSKGTLAQLHLTPGPCEMSPRRIGVAVQRITDKARRPFQSGVFWYESQLNSATIRSFLRERLRVT